MIVRFTPRAIQELTDLAHYIRSQNPSASQRVRTAILDGIEIISRYPNAGRRQSLENVRKLVIRRYPYLIYYMVDAEADELVVISIRHAAREREYSDA